MKITLIAAMDDNLGIGRDGKLPWHNKYDLQHFKNYTDGKLICMGMRTWESLPIRPLENRVHIILSKKGYHNDLTQHYNDFNFYVVNNIQDVINTAEYRESRELIIIGGASIYEQFMPHATHMVLTHINGDYNCDTFFPEFDASEWFAYEWKDIENGKIDYMERT